MADYRELRGFLQSPREVSRCIYPPEELARRRYGGTSRYMSQAICPVTNAIATPCARVCAPSFPIAL